MNDIKTTKDLENEVIALSGEPKLTGHDIMSLHRFGEETRHMITFTVLSYDSPVGSKGEHMRLFLSDDGFEKAVFPDFHAHAVNPPHKVSSSTNGCKYAEWFSQSAH